MNTNNFVSYYVSGTYNALNGCHTCGGGLGYYIGKTKYDAEKVKKIDTETIKDEIFLIKEKIADKENKIANGTNTSLTRRDLNLNKKDLNFLETELATRQGKTPTQPVATQPTAGVTLPKNEVATGNVTIPQVVQNQAVTPKTENTQPPKTNKNKKILIIGGSVLAAGVLFYFITKKSR